MAYYTPKQMTAADYAVGGQQWGYPAFPPEEVELDDQPLKPETKYAYLSLLASLAGVTAAVLTVVLGIMRIATTKVALQWPQGKFLADVNADTWRDRLFTFNPAIVLDLWAPLIFGGISFAVHFGRDPPLKPVHSNFAIYATWNLVQALWANMGYCGGMGIIVGISSLVTAVLGLITFSVAPLSIVSLQIDIQKPALEGDEPGMNDIDQDPPTKAGGSSGRASIYSTGFLHRPQPQHAVMAPQQMKYQGPGVLQQTWGTGAYSRETVPVESGAWKGMR